MTAASGALGTGRSTGGPAKAATLAMVWAYACATAIKGTKSIKTRSHGHRCKSRFRLGFDQLRKWICRDLEADLANAQNHPRNRKSRVV